MSSISSSLELFVKNPLVTIIPIIIAIVSFILMIIFYLKSKYVKKPFYIIKSVNLIRNLVSKIDLVEITFKGHDVPNLTISKLLFWNAGRNTIRSEDIAKADPLIVSINQNFKMLDAKIIFTKNPANSFSIIDFNNDQFKFDFDFIDNNEGSIVQIIHTGTSNLDLKVNGTIKGAGNPMRKEFYTELIKVFYGFPLNPQMQNPRKILITLGLGIGILLIIFLVLLITSIYSNYYSRILMIILGILAGSILVGTAYSILLFFMTRKIPQGFESFWEEI
jgi:hypothetical protein